MRRPEGSLKTLERLCLSPRVAPDILSRLNRAKRPHRSPLGAHLSPDPPFLTLQMAKSQFKAGGPTRGRLRVRKMGMGSGAKVAKLKAKGNSKGKKRG